MDHVVVTRTPWIYKHECLFGDQTLVSGSNCHANVTGTKGWAPGWLTCQPPSSVVVDLGSPALVSKITLRSTNILASPRQMELLTGTSETGPWTLAYMLRRAQCNRLGLDVPGNTDANDNESSSDESFYFLGHCTNDHLPSWSHRATGGLIDDQDPQMMKNRGIILKGQGEVHVARWWLLRILDTNGSHYVGINHFTFFGRKNPLSAPENVSTSVVRFNHSDTLKISWSTDSTHQAASFTVVAFPCGIGRGSGGFQMTCPGEQNEVIFDTLKPDVEYVFIVFGVDEHGVEGAPSKPTTPMAVASSGWTLLHFSEQDVDDPSSMSGAVHTSQEERPSAANESSDRVFSMEEHKVVVSTETALEGSHLRLKLQEHIQQLDSLNEKDFAAVYEESIKKMNSGYFDEVENISVATTVTMFLSSTFDDTTAERNYLMEFAYPILKSFCQNLGLTFSVVDLRWGVRNEATDDHMTIEVCLGELDRCLRNSTAASFVFLSGEKYGWRALPNRVVADELDQILQYIPDGDAKETILHWYAKDENQVPPVYILQRISVMQKKSIKYNDFWKDAQDLMQTAIRQALVVSPDIPEALKNNWSVSVTEREVLSGLFNIRNISVDAFVLMRTIEGLEEAAKRNDDQAKTYFTEQDSDRSLVYDLRARVKALIPTSRFNEYSIPWSSGGISFENPGHREYMRELAAGFVAQTQMQVKNSLSRRRLLSPLERESMHHSSFALRRAKSFLGREDLRSAAQQLAMTEGPAVRCIYGLSGTGKTSLMSVAAVDARERVAPDAVIIFRACGTSASSSSALELMRSIAAQLASIYGFEQQCFDDFDLQVNDFRRSLGASTNERPLLLFIDSLDQLSDQNNERSDPWRWLPSDEDGNPFTKVVVSCLPDAKYGVLQGLHLPPNRTMEICGVTLKEAMAVLNSWLARSGRKLQPNQAHVVETQIGKVKSVTMLHLRLVFDRIVKWRSYDDPEDLPPSVSDLINLIFDDLERSHGARLVKELMGLLSASQCGLSESNMLDLISGNDKVLGYKGVYGSVLEYHDPPTRRLPPLVFSRLRRDLGEYVVERGENGVVVLNLYHRQFWELVSDRYFSDPEMQAKYFSALADYFSGRLAAMFPERHIEAHPLRFNTEKAKTMGTLLGLPNRQKIKELGGAFRGAGRLEELMRYLCDLRYIEAVFEAGRAYAQDLLVDYGDCLDKIKKVHATGPDVAALAAQTTSFYRFVRKWFHALCLQSDLLMGLAANSPPSSDVARTALSLRDPRPWVEWRNAPNDFDACIQTQMCPAALACCSFSPSGHEFAVGAGQVCLVFHTLSSKQLARFKEHTGLVQSLCFSPDGSLVLSCGREGQARVWSSANGEPVSCLGPHLGWVNACAWSCLHDLAITGCANTLVHVWKPSDGVMLGVLEGHTGPIHSCCFLGSTQQAVTGSEDGTVVVWDLQRMDADARIAADSTVNCVDASFDGKLIAVASSLAICTLWSAGSEKRGGFAVLHRLGGHVSEVWACCFSPDAREIVTGAADRVCRIFCTRTGALLGKVQGHLQWVVAVSYSGDFVLTASCDHSAKLWERDFVTLKEAGAARMEERPLAGLRFIDGGSRLRGITTQLASFVVDLGSMDIVSEEHPKRGSEGQAERKADLCPDGKRWAFASYDRSYNLLLPIDGGELAKIRQDVPFPVCNTTVRWHPTDPDRILVGGHGDKVALMNVHGPMLENQWAGSGWVMDLSWAPGGQGVAAACQAGTLWLDAGTQGGTRVIGPAALSVCVDSGGRRAAVVTMSGGGYHVSPTGCIIIDVRSGECLAVADPTLQHAKLQDRNCRWVGGDQLVVVATAGTSALDCPALSVIRAEDGSCVARFCSPYPSNFTCLDVAATAEGLPAVVLSDEAGRIFVLSIRNIEY
jgi:WD40 repeat protein